MNKMMSVTALAAALTLTASCALAATADAKIVAPNTEKITAPFAGTLLPFDYENGDSVPSTKNIQKICDMLNLSFEELFR